MSVVLINPNLVVQRNDPFTTGIVYMPISLAYLAASLQKHGQSIEVIDAFAERPDQARNEDRFIIYGLTYSEVVKRIPKDAKIVFIYAINLTNHISTLGLVRAVKCAFSHVPVVVLENTQAVTAYTLHLVADDFYDAGADYILTGEADLRGIVLLQAILNGDEDLSLIDGLGTRAFYNRPKGPIEDLDALPFPAWELFPMQNYWALRFGHGPQKTGRYLPLLTSRGCPYPCSFCVVPATNNQTWRSRSATNVVDEIEFLVSTYGVREFHIEDLNPTISDSRIREICREILDRKLDIVWKIAAGTKVETIRDENTLDLMANAGCRYISISPETGSADVLKRMRKPFKLDHAIRLVKHMNRIGIRSQACFILGYPGETDTDRDMTWELVQNLTRQGVDEIALFITTPIPGSAIQSAFEEEASLSELTFSPSWRKDYDHLNRFRLRLYVFFLLWKCRYFPFKILTQIVNFLKRRFETKMEMVPYRALWLIWHARKHYLRT